MKVKERDIVAAMIFSKDGKLFLGKKDPTKGGVYKDCWHIPGGGIEQGETNEQAFVREIKEETGIDATDLKLVLIDDEGTGQSEKVDEKTGEMYLVKMKFFVYKIELETNADETIVSLDDDLAEYQWIELSKLNSVKLTPPGLKLFTKLGYL